MTANDIENKPVTTEAKTNGCRVFGFENFETNPEGDAKAGISSTCSVHRRRLKYRKRVIVLCQDKEKDVETCPQKISGNTHKKLKVSDAANSASLES